MTKSKKAACALAMALTILTANQAWAAWCLQLNGALSGDLGFFYFNGTRPTTSGQIVRLAGRVAGMSPVFGTATVYKDGKTLEVACTFWADGVEGQFDVALTGLGLRTGDGWANYGTYGTDGDVTAKVVSCRNEP